MSYCKSYIIKLFYHVLYQKAHYPDLVATSGDYLRIWRVGNSEVRLEALLNNV